MQGQVHEKQKALLAVTGNNELAVGREVVIECLKGGELQRGARIQIAEGLIEAAENFILCGGRL
jgi:hypothetical protein